MKLNNDEIEFLTMLVGCEANNIAKQIEWYHKYEPENKEHIYTRDLYAARLSQLKLKLDAVYTEGEENE